MKTNNRRHKVLFNHFTRLPTNIGYCVAKGEDVFISDSYDVSTNENFMIYLPDYVIAPKCVCLKFHNKGVVWALQHKLNRGINKPFRPDVYNIELHNVAGTLKKEVVIREGGCLQVLVSNDNVNEMPDITPKPVYHVSCQNNAFMSPRINSFNYHVVPYIRMRIAIWEVMNDIRDKVTNALDRTGLPRDVFGTILDFAPDQITDKITVSAIVLYKREYKRRKLIHMSGYEWDSDQGRDGWFS